MPLELCKLARNGRSRNWKENIEKLADNRYCAFQGINYYGYKHSIYSLRNVFKSIDLSPAYIHGVNYLKDIQYQTKDYTLIGDKGYISSEIQLIYLKPIISNLILLWEQTKMDTKNNPMWIENLENA